MVQSIPRTRSLLSEIDLSDPNGLNGKVIEVDIDFTYRESKDITEVKNAEFIMTKLGNLQLHKIKLLDCRFIGLDDFNNFEQNRGFIYISECNESSKISIKGGYKSITLDKSVIFNFHDDSQTPAYVIYGCEFRGFQILGWCKKIEIRSSVLTSEKARYSIFHYLVGQYQLRKWPSLFNKEISFKAVCNEAVFESVRVNPFYLATKCHDKTSLDLTKSRLVDNWSKLRKEYSGVRLFIIFFLTLAFFLPLLAKSFFLLILNNVKDFIHVDHVPLWKALAFGGKEGGMAYVYLGLTVLLLVYNIGRFYLTISIAKLKEEERFLKDANFTLVSIHPDKISKHINLHKALRVLLVLAKIYSILKIIDALSISVPWIIS